MLIVELLSLEDWFREEENKNNFLKKLTALQQVLNSNVQAQGSRNGSLQSFSQQKNEAINSLMGIDLSQLSDSQLRFLEIYGARKYLGKKGAVALKETFIEETHDLAHLLKIVSEYTQSIQNFKSQIQNISKGLQLFRDEVEGFESTEKPRFSIIFRNNTSIDNLEDLENSSKKWRQVIHGLSKGLDLNEEEFEIIGTRNGSIVIDLYVVAAAMIPIGFILNRSFDIIERFALMTKRVNTVYNTDPTDEAFKQVEDEIKKANEKYFRLTKNISSQNLAKELLKHEPEGTDKNERVAFIEGSVKKILDHLKNGGDLDMFIPKQIKETEDEERDEGLEELRESIQDFRQKKESIGADEVIKLLQQIEFDDDDDQEGDSP